MNDLPRLCDLCQLPVGSTDYQLLTKEGLKRFCCEGCQGIYRMLHESDILDSSNVP